MKKSTTKITLTLALLLVCNCFVIAQKLPDLIPFKDQNLYGYCDSNMNVIIEAQYQYAYPLVENRAIVIKDDLSGFLDSKGNQVIPCIYKYANSFKEGVAKVGISTGEKKYINKKGQFVSGPDDNPGTPPIDRGAYKKNKLGPIKEDRYFYRSQNYTEGYVTVDDDTISSSEYTYPYYSECYSTSDNYDQRFQHFYESRAVVSGKDGQGYIDLNGDLVIDTVFDVAFNFKEGRAKVKLNGKYGFIDKQGQVVGEIKYDQACYFYDGMAQVVVNGKCGYINLEGQEIISLIYDYWQGESFSSFQNGLVRVRINEKFGILDKKGNEVTSVKYDDILPFHRNRAIVKVNDKMGVIDEGGNELIPPIYGYLGWLDKFAFIVQTDFDEREYGLINIDGKILVAATRRRPMNKSCAGLYRISPSTNGYFFIDKYGTKYVK